MGTLDLIKAQLRNKAKQHPDVHQPEGSLVMPHARRHQGGHITPPRLSNSAPPIDISPTVPTKAAAALSMPRVNSGTSGLRIGRINPRFGRHSNPEYTTLHALDISQQSSEQEDAGRDHPPSDWLAHFTRPQPTHSSDPSDASYDSSESSSPSGYIVLTPKDVHALRRDLRVLARASSQMEQHVSLFTGRSD